MSYFTADNLTDSILYVLNEYGNDYERECISKARRRGVGGSRSEWDALTSCARALNEYLSQVTHLSFEEVPHHVYEIALGRKKNWLEYEMTQEEALLLCMQALKKRGQ